MPPIEFTKQADQPLFPDIFWQRPTMRSRGGRLLVIGGHKTEFSLVQAIFECAESSGIGEVQAAMPDTLRRLVGEAAFARFVPASPSGSLGKAALGELLHLASDFDALVIGANLTNNAETAMMIESLVNEYEGKLIITEEAIEILKFHPDLITGNPKVLVVASMGGLFSLANHHHMPITIRPNSGVIGKMEILRQLVDISKAAYLVYGPELMVAAEGKVSLTTATHDLTANGGLAAGVSATFWLQHPRRPFAALTTAAYILKGITPTNQSAVDSQIRATISANDQ